MKVLHVVSSRERRGAEMFASCLVAALDRDGIEQRVAVMRDSGSAVGFEAPIFQLGDGGIKGPGLHLEPGAVASLGRVARDFRPDVIQAHGGEPLKYVAASASSPWARVVYRRIGDSQQFRGARLREHLFAALMRRAARVVAVADVLKVELVQRYRVNPDRIVMIPNAIDPAASQPRRSRSEVRTELGIDKDTQVVLSIGALTWEKDPLGHVNAVARLADAHPVAHVFVGDGPLRGNLERAVRRCGENYQPFVLGSRDDVGDLLAAADLLLMASRTEGMPASVIEAGMAGLPVVGYALSGVPEVVENGVTGRLVSPGDETGLTRALAELLHDPVARRSMGASARQRCSERFDIGVVAPMYRRVYEEVAVA